jgi:NADH-quinone oxidoreductase subunit L
MSESIGYAGAWLCWIIPMVGAALTPAFAKLGPRVRDYAAVLSSFLAAIFASFMFPLLGNVHYFNQNPIVGN